MQFLDTVGDIVYCSRTCMVDYIVGRVDNNLDQVDSRHAVCRYWYWYCLGVMKVVGV